MSGHNRWSQIKNQKGVNDARRTKIFSKILKAISAAAKTEQNPDFNPRLRSIIETGRQNNIPKDNIARAIAKAKDTKDMEEIVIESYGPEKVALIITVLTDNRNRTISEVKKILTDHETKIGGMGSARWAYDAPTPESQWKPKFTQQISDEGATKLQALIEALEEQEDVQEVFENAE